MRKSWGLLTAIGLYWLAGVLLIAQKPGLQYDEALLVAGAVHMQHSPAPFELAQTPDSWVCPFGRCIPLMSGYYVGAVKQYLALPFFALFGPRAPVVRIIPLILGAFGIWGIYWLVLEFFGRNIAFVSALIIAINPAFLDLTTFDNGPIAAVMAALGLTCAALVVCHRRQSLGAAFALGAAMGFGVWARANFLWVLAAGALAVLITFRPWKLIRSARGAAIVAGGILGGAPFLIFQLVSGWATWKVQKAFKVAAPMSLLLRERLFWLAETLLSDGEHRGIWAGPRLPAWQLWLFPALVAASCLVCIQFRYRLQTDRRLFARALAVTFLGTGAALFFSRLPIAEHHLVMLVPIAAVMVVIAFTILREAFPWTRAPYACLFAIYVFCALYWEGAAIRGLHKSGGVGAWSDAVLETARYLDRNSRGRDVMLLDWGLQYNLYVLTVGRVKLWEIYSPQSEMVSSDGRPWIDEIRQGGVFVLNGSDNPEYPKPGAGFRNALAIGRPVLQKHTVFQRNGRTYADIYDITPNTVHAPPSPEDTIETRITMDDRRFDRRLTGFYAPEGNFRWTGRNFSVRLNVAGQDAAGSELIMSVYVPDVLIQKLGPITLAANCGSHALAPEKWSRPGNYTYRRALRPDWTPSGLVQVDFALDKALPPGVSDRRELGIIVREVSVQPN